MSKVPPKHHSSIRPRSHPQTHSTHQAPTMAPRSSAQPNAHPQTHAAHQAPKTALDRLAKATGSTPSSDASHAQQHDTFKPSHTSGDGAHGNGESAGSSQQLLHAMKGFASPPGGHDGGGAGRRLQEASGHADPKRDEANAAWHAPHVQPAQQGTHSEQRSELTQKVAGLAPARQEDWSRVDSRGSQEVKRTDHMQDIAEGKKALDSAFDDVKATPFERSLVTAMGMTETSDFRPDSRDKQKDGHEPSKNWGAFNMNTDMVRDIASGLGVRDFDPNRLNSEANPDGKGAMGLRESAQLLIGGMRKYGADWVTSYQRGGASAFEGGRAMNNGQASRINPNPPAGLKMWDYKNAIQKQTVDILWSIGSRGDMLTNGQKYNWVIPPTNYQSS